MYCVSTFDFLNLAALREPEARLIINSAQQHARNKCKSTVHARGRLDVSVFMPRTVIVLPLRENTNGSRYEFVENLFRGIHGVTIN